MVYLLFSFFYFALQYLYLSVKLLKFKRFFLILFTLFDQFIKHIF